jgi:Rod binding domain-containing protein
MGSTYPIQKFPPTQHQKLEKQAQRLVAQTFYGTLLKQMRQSPFKSELFEGGRGGQAFSELFDQRLAEKMASGTRNQLVHAIVHRFESKPGTAAPREVYKRLSPTPHSYESRA